MQHLSVWEILRVTDAVSSPQIRAWIRELESVGRVEIKPNFNSLIWRIGLAIAIVVLFISIRFQAGDIGQRGLAIAIIGFAVLIIGSSIFIRITYGGKALVIERDSLVTMEGKRIPWTDVQDVTVYSDPRGRTPISVQVNLTEQAWSDHMAAQGAGGRVMHGANKLLTRNRAIMLPTYLDAKPQEMAEWLNTHARGKVAESS